MAGFTYIYRSSDGERLTGEIDAESRDAVFATLREQGIRPIKVLAKDGSKANGEERSGVRRRIVVSSIIVAAVIAGVLSFALGRKTSPSSDFVITERGPVKINEAAPLHRQRIPGNRERIERFPDTLFKYPAEAILAKFAEPGRNVTMPAELPSNEDFRLALAEPIKYASTEFSEHIDLKRIVVGIKREMSAYVAAGGTPTEYIAELVKRQKMEATYRENAETRLVEMLSSKPSQNTIAKAYDYWLKANAQLEAMGIYPLVLPDILRAYQMNMDLEE